MVRRELFCWNVFVWNSFIPNGFITAFFGLKSFSIAFVANSSKV